MSALYGRWQTEPYSPPPLDDDGRVPRNRFNNIYLFLPQMLPRQCAYLPLPGIVTIALRLKIDAVPAMIGWENRGGRSFPVRFHSQMVSTV